MIRHEKADTRDNKRLPRRAPSPCSTPTGRHSRHMTKCDRKKGSPQGLHVPLVHNPTRRLLPSLRSPKTVTTTALRQAGRQRALAMVPAQQRVSSDSPLASRANPGGRKHGRVEHTALRAARHSPSRAANSGNACASLTARRSRLTSLAAPPPLLPPRWWSPPTVLPTGGTPWSPQRAPPLPARPRGPSP